VIFVIEVIFSRSHALRGNACPDAPRPAKKKRNRSDGTIPCCHPHLLQDAERPGRHSHAERGNEKTVSGQGNELAFLRLRYKALRAKSWNKIEPCVFLR